MSMMISERMSASRREVLAGLSAISVSPTPSSAERSSVIEPFEIPFQDQVVADLNRRLESPRWADAVTSDWSYGMERNFLQALVRYWSHEYRWDGRRTLLNRLPHYKATIDGYGLHYLHFRSERGQGMPLLLMNGWPSSFTEYQRLAPSLVKGEGGFDVVVPTHPGFGFSDRPTRPYQIEPSDLYPKLMTELGYDRFIVSGTDIGSGVATRIALHHPDRVVGLHVSAIAAKPVAQGAPPATAEERAYEARSQIWDRDEGGYQAIQSSRPQTLAFGLADSPVGLASWIVEKFRNWSDCGGDVLAVFPFEALIDNLMVYWTTNTIASSVRYYYEASRLRPALRADDFVTVPTSVTMWPHDLALAPRAAAERLYNVTRYAVAARGGHFPAWEVPDIYEQELRQFAASLVR